jgi:hypothetical protein
MQDIDLNSWEQLQDKLAALENERRRQQSSSRLLYRGQRDSGLHLLTTLERTGKVRVPLKRYHHLISVVRPQIESFTGTTWNILSYPSGIEKWLEENDTFMPNAFGWSPEFQGTYSYMAYLRHYGFPSPFLDWTTSPYVAAYFAFRRPSHPCNNVSIYAYLESTSNFGLKSGSINKPCIHRFGQYVKTDRRHFLQQSQYTVCIIHDGEWQYAPHEEAFTRNYQDQDVLWKFNVPYSERVKVLRILDGYNINALSLFGSDESLLETIALREIYFQDKEL